MIKQSLNRNIFTVFLALSLSLDSFHEFIPISKNECQIQILDLALQNITNTKCSPFHKFMLMSTYLWQLLPKLPPLPPRYI